MLRLSSRQAWQQFFSARCADPAKAYEFYQLIDKLERENESVSQSKLQGLGFSLPEVRDFIQASQPTAELAAVLDNLAARGLRDYVRVDYNVIRGLAYYTGVVFEAFDRQGQFRAIAGGGRYDNLIKLMSGGKVDLPALGFGMGDVVLLEVLRQRKRLPVFNAAVDVFCLIDEETLRPDSLHLIAQLRNAGWAVDFGLTPAKPDKQFKRAVELGAAATVKLERQPDGKCAVRLKNLRTRTEQLVEASAVVAALQADLRGSQPSPTGASSV
jgi:histidyl-tRNA synthetase